MFITKKHLPRRTFLRGMGVTLALPLLDSMIPARTLLAQTAARPSPRLGFVYVPHGAIMANVDADRRWRRLRVHADPQAARAVPRPAERRQRARPPGRRHHRGPLAEPDDLAERRAPQGDAGRRRLRRRHRRPDRGAGDRPGHDAAVDGAGHRGSLGPDRLLRPRLRLHLHEHAVVADADDAAADGDQSAQGLRADVRRRAAAPASGWRASRRIAASSTRSRSEASTLQLQLGPSDRKTMNAVPGERPRDRAPHSARGEEPGRRDRCSCRRARPASRSSTKSTSS